MVHVMHCCFMCQICELACYISMFHISNCLFPLVLQLTILSCSSTIATIYGSTTLNYQAATCFIEYSLPDLTPDQRQSMRDISKGEGGKMKYLERNVQKKRKYQSPNRRAVHKELMIELLMSVVLSVCYIIVSK